MNHYEDVEQLLFKGFLTESLHFNGFDFVLKSLTDSEFQRIKDRTPSNHPAKDGIYDCWYLAYSILQINGVYCLSDRDNTSLRLFTSLRKWPLKAINRLIHRCVTFNKRLTEAYKKLEAYCYEPQSRVYWKAYSGLPLNSIAVTGIPGTDLNPLNPIQVQWLSYNRSEDERVSFDVNWSYVRWMGAFLNGKAAEKIDKEVLDQRGKEEDYRQEVMNRAKGLSDNVDNLESPYSKSSRDDELKKLLYDLDVVVNNKKDNHELAMDSARAKAVDNYRIFKKEERDRKIAAIQARSQAIDTSDLSQPFELFDQNRMQDVTDMQQRRELIMTVLGISAAELDSIDQEYTVPAEILSSIAPTSNSTRSTILPVNVNPGNFSGEVTRGGIPLKPRDNQK